MRRKVTLTDSPGAAISSWVISEHGRFCTDLCPSPARVEAGVHAGEIALLDMHVELRGIEPGVTQELAHFIERCAALQKMRGEGTKPVRRELRAGAA